MDQNIRKVLTDRIDPVFGERIRKARREMGLTIKEVADKCAISSTHLTRLELAQRRITSPRVIRSLSEVLNIPYDELCTLAGPEFRPENGSAIRQAFPSIQSDIQEQAISEFATLLTSTALLPEQLHHLMEQCRAYILYCSSSSGE